MYLTSFLGSAKRWIVANDGPEGKGNEVADAAEPDDGQEFGGRPALSWAMRPAPNGARCSSA